MKVVRQQSFLHLYHIIQYYSVRFSKNENVLFISIILNL